MSNETLMNDKVVSYELFQLTEEFAALCYKKILQMISFNEVVESKNRSIVNRLNEIKNFLLNESNHVPSDIKEKIMLALARMIHIKDCISPTFESFSKNTSVKHWIETIDNKSTEVVSIEEYQKLKEIHSKLIIIGCTYACNENDLENNKNTIDGIKRHVESYFQEKNIPKDDLEKIQNILNPKT